MARYHTLEEFPNLLGDSSAVRAQDLFADAAHGRDCPAQRDLAREAHRRRNGAARQERHERQQDRDAGRGPVLLDGAGGEVELQSQYC